MTHIGQKNNKAFGLINSQTREQNNSVLKNISYVYMYKTERDKNKKKWIVHNGHFLEIMRKPIA